MLCPSLGAALFQGRAAETFLSGGGRRTCRNEVQWLCCWEEAAGLGEPWLLCPLCVALVSQRLGLLSVVTWGQSCLALQGLCWLGRWCLGWALGLEPMDRMAEAAAEGGA